MFYSVKSAIEYIESQRHKRTIEDFQKTLDELHINVHQKNMIHIAGTNGKGSTVNYLRAILNAHGYKVGTFTSPYLVKHNDRICIDGTPISDTALLYYINKYYDVIEREHLSMFEIDTLIMLDYFDTQPLDFRIIECGIGGEHDKTNVIDSKISAITNIGMDHIEQIGPTLFDIINEKMGIIKRGNLFVTSETKGTILARLQEQCDVMDATMIVVPEYETTHYPFEFQYRDMDITLKDQGIYQVSNARLALTIASRLITLDHDKTIKAVENTNWPGRFEKMQYLNKPVIIDGAHNMPGLQSLLKTLKCIEQQDIGIVFSALKDKQVEEMLGELAHTPYSIYVTSFNDERVDGSLKKMVQDTDMMVYTASYKDALKTAALKHDLVVVTGSLHFISTVRKYLEEV